MAKKKVTVILDIDRTRQKAEFALMSKDINKITSELLKLPAGSKEFERGLSTLDKKMKELGKAQGLKELNRVQKRLFSQMNDVVDKNSNEYRILEVQIQALNPRIQELRSRNNQLRSSMISSNQTLRETGSSYEYISLKAFGLYQAIKTGILSAQVFVDKLRDISDAETDVQKTTGLTKKEVAELREELGKTPDRTLQKELLEIAEIGGRLGIKGKQNILEFTKAVNILSIAQIDSFESAEEVTTVYGRLRNILTDFKTDDTAQDLLRLGNAVNFLETQGPSTAKGITEIANVVAGAGIPLGLTTDKVIGLSATLDELGVPAERAGGSIQDILTILAKSPEKLAKALDIDPSEFVRLVENDIAGALTLVAQKTFEASESNVDFVKNLSDLGINNKRTIDVFAKLGGNVDLLNLRFKEAKENLQNIDSVTSEYNKKNESFAATLDKVQKKFESFTTGNEFLEVAEQVAEILLKITSGSISFTQALIDNRELIIPLVAAYATYKAGIIATTVATKSAATATKLLEIAQGRLNAAGKANPYLLLASVLIAIGVYLGQMYNSNEKFRASVDGLFNIGSKVFGYISNKSSEIYFRIVEMKNAAVEFGAQFGVTGKNISKVFDFLINVGEKYFTVITTPYRWLANQGAKILKTFGIDLVDIKDKFVDAFEEGRLKSIQASKGIQNLDERTKQATERAEMLRAKLGDVDEATDIDIELVKDFELANKEVELLNKQLNITRQLLEFEGDAIATQVLLDDLEATKVALEEIEKVRAVSSDEQRQPASTTGNQRQPRATSGDQQTITITPKIELSTEEQLNSLNEQIQELYKELEQAQAQGDDEKTFSIANEIFGKKEDFEKLKEKSREEIANALDILYPKNSDNAGLLEEAIASIDRDTQAFTDSASNAYREQRLAIEEELLAKEITKEEADNRLENLETNHQLNLLNIQIEGEKNRLTLIEKGSKEYLATEQKINDLSLKIQETELTAKVAIEKSKTDAAQKGADDRAKIAEQELKQQLQQIDNSKAQFDQFLNIAEDISETIFQVKENRLQKEQERDTTDLEEKEEADLLKFEEEQETEEQRYQNELQQRIDRTNLETEDEATKNAILARIEAERQARENKSEKAKTKFLENQAKARTDLEAKQQEEREKLDKKKRELQRTFLISSTIAEIGTAIAKGIAAVLAAPTIPQKTAIGIANAGSLIALTAQKSKAIADANKLEKGGVQLGAKKIDKLKAGVTSGSRHRKGGNLTIDMATGEPLYETESQEAVMVLSREMTKNNGGILSMFFDQVNNRNNQPIEQNPLFQNYVAEYASRKFSQTVPKFEDGGIAIQPNFALQKFTAQKQQIIVVQTDNTSTDNILERIEDLLIIFEPFIVKSEEIQIQEELFSI